MNDAYHILIVDDDHAHAEMVIEFLRISGYSHMDWAENIRDFWKQLDLGSYDIVLLDYKLPDGTGLDILEQMQSQGYRIPVVMVTGQGNERVAVQAIQHGAADYLRMVPSVDIWPEAEEILLEYFDGALLGTITAEQAIGGAAEEIQYLLED